MWNGIAFWSRHLPLDTKESSHRNAIVCWCSHENLHTIYILRSLSKSCAKIHYAHILSASPICSEIHKLHTVFVKISKSVVESCNVVKFVQCTLSTFQRAVRCKHQGGSLGEQVWTGPQSWSSDFTRLGIGFLYRVFKSLNSGLVTYGISEFK